MARFKQEIVSKFIFYLIIYYDYEDYAYYDSDDREIQPNVLRYKLSTARWTAESPDYEPEHFTSSFCPRVENIFNYDVGNKK